MDSLEHQLELIVTQHCVLESEHVVILLSSHQGPVLDCELLGLMGLQNEFKRQNLDVVVVKRCVNYWLALGRRLCADWRCIFIDQGELVSFDFDIKVGWVLQNYLMCGGFSDRTDHVNFFNLLRVLHGYCKVVEHVLSGLLY